MTILLTTEEKIAVLKLAKKLLGPNGENWIQGTWFGRRVGPGSRRYIQTENGPEALASPAYRWTKGLVHMSYQTVQPSQADCWCVLGAMEEAAHRLGYKPRRRRSRILGAATSLKDWAQRRKNYEEVDVLNDYAESFKDIKQAINGRLRELEQELKS